LKKFPGQTWGKNPKGPPKKTRGRKERVLGDVFFQQRGTAVYRWGLASESKSALEEKTSTGRGLKNDTKNMNLIVGGAAAYRERKICRIQDKASGWTKKGG